jgi:spore germination protein KA
VFKRTIKKIRFAQFKKNIQPKKSEKNNETPENISKYLYENIKTIKAALGYSTDLIIREFSFGKNQDTEAALIFVDGLSNIAVINDNIIDPLIYKSSFLDYNKTLDKSNIDDIKKTMLSANQITDVSTLDEAISGFLAGDALLMIDGANKALIINSKGWEKRGISEPATESVIRGPREGFTENLRTNTSLIRRILKTPALTMETLILGKKTKTTICISYIRDVANDELIKDIKNRLKVIDTDAILESGYIEQYIEDAPFSIFPTIAYTEKPDVVAAKLLEGRVAILVDGTPFVLTAPMLFVESFQTAEDYYARPFFMTMLRFVRFTAFFVSVLAPAFYVAITTFHQELIPTDLLFTMVAAREGTPFPTVFEAAIMIAAFEILREAGVRLPRPVGQAISIVGALVMGDAAVSAGLIGAPMVIVIAITAVSIFAVPSQAESGAILRIIMLILAGTMGEFGITIGLLVLLVHLSSLKSFGFSYLSPISPFLSKDNKDTFMRMPLWVMHKRPTGMAKNDQTRQDNFRPTSITNKNINTKQEGEHSEKSN